MSDNKYDDTKNQDSFQMNFDNNVVDLTNTNRKNTSNTNNNDFGNRYGSYNDSYSNYNQYDTASNNHINEKYYGNVRHQNITSILVMVAMAINVICFLYFLTNGNVNYNTFKNTIGIVNAISFFVYLADAIVLQSRYQSISLIVFSIFLSGFYPLWRCHITQEGKKIAIIYTVILIVLAFPVIGNVTKNADYTTINTYKR